MLKLNLKINYLVLADSLLFCNILQNYYNNHSTKLEETVIEFHF